MLSSALSTILTLVLGISAVNAVTFNVTVGANAQLLFEPNQVTAAMGDIINFTFMGGNHTATQSTFDNPCAASGFRSGFQPVGTSGQPTTFSILVNTTTPIWVYCAQGRHCQSGMVMAVNAAATGDRTFSAFQQLAASASGTAPSGGASGSAASPIGPSTSGGAAGSASGSASVTVSGAAASNAPTPSGGALGSIAPSAIGLFMSLLVSVLFRL